MQRDAYGALRDNAMLPDTVLNTVQGKVNSGLETGTIAPGGTVSGTALIFSNGAQLPMPSVANSIRRVAQKNQVRL
jgi:membrane protease subunit (stomatin/prohibitin family)